jgi:hypothetical protein
VHAFTSAWDGPEEVTTTVATNGDARHAEEKRKLANGFGQGLTRAFELALVPLLFGLGGYAVDRWLGTRFLFATLLALFALVGTGVKLYYGYAREMEQLEADAPWRRQPRPGAPR